MQTLFILISAAFFWNAVVGDEDDQTILGQIIDKAMNASCKNAALRSKIETCYNSVPKWVLQIMYDCMDEPYITGKEVMDDYCETENIDSGEGDDEVGEDDDDAKDVDAEEDIDDAEEDSDDAEEDSDDEEEDTDDAEEDIDNAEKNIDSAEEDIDDTEENIDEEDNFEEVSECVVKKYECDERNISEDEVNGMLDACWSIEEHAEEEGMKELFEELKKIYSDIEGKSSTDETAFDANKL